MESIHKQQPQPQQPTAPPQYNQQQVVMQVPACCTACGGPITFERDTCTLVTLVVCCGLCALFCLPKREAVCARCGAKQGYELD